MHKKTAEKKKMNSSAIRFGVMFLLAAYYTLCITKLATTKERKKQPNGTQNYISSMINWMKSSQLEEEEE